MPVITAGSKYLPRLNGYIYEQQRLCSRLAVFIYAATALLALLFLLHRSVRPPLTRRLVWGQVIGNNSTWASRKPLIQTVSDPLGSLSSRVPLGQGQGRFGNEANRTISKRGASGTAPSGLGGFGEKIRMGEEETTQTPAASRSRGVSANWSDGTGLSSGLPLPDPSSPAAEQTGHVRNTTFPPTTPVRRIAGGSAGSVEKGQGSMDYDGLGGTSLDETRFMAELAWDTPHQSTTAFGHHLTDDEHILYSVNGPSGSGTGVDGASSTPRHFGMDFSRPPPPSMMASTAANHAIFGLPQSPFQPVQPLPVNMTGADSFSLVGGLRLDQVDTRNADSVEPMDPMSNPSSTATDRRHQITSISIPSAPTPRTRADYPSSDDVMFPSSYPSASPSLPPPPSTTDYHFDPSAVMYSGPGAVVDGGIRMVPPHNHGEGGAVDFHVHEAYDNSSASWQRHTRVYGGGVCLACAAAAGDGGFYGARVRPEDRR